MVADTRRRARVSRMRSMAVSKAFDAWGDHANKSARTEAWVKKWRHVLLCKSVF
jgi:hypothetical protein